MYLCKMIKVVLLVNVNEDINNYRNIFEDNLADIVILLSLSLLIVLIVIVP